MTLVPFNRRPLTFGRVMEQPPADLIKNTLGLVNASPEDAVRYGGDVTRAALSAIQLANDRTYVVVDVKAHLLMPGMSPAIPGWHTDGVPRSSDGNPQGEDGPLLSQQVNIDQIGRGTHYHLIVTGDHCRAEFFTMSHADLDVPRDGDPKLYADITSQVNGLRSRGFRQHFKIIPSCTVVNFDWWDIHRALQSSGTEWRYLIRVTETDYIAPDTDLRRVIRTQHQVYSPDTFGW